MKVFQRIGVALVLVTLLASCSAIRLTYNNAELLVRFKVGDYVDLDEAQYDRFRSRLTQFHAWHRANELPLYAEFFGEAAQKARRAATREELASMAQEVRMRFRALVARALEDAAPILATLSAQQVAELERNFAKARAKYADEFLSGDARRQHRARLKRMLERFRDWTGDLSDEQESRIERFVRAHARLEAMRFEDRARWNREMVALIRENRGARELGPRLARLFTHPESRRPPEFAAALSRWESELLELILDIERSLTAEQRAHVVRRMERHAEEFRVLAAEKGVARAAAGP